ncbi:MAG: TIGR04222 domain-containing membrane protein [Betaproteobacteria bacterium]|nr:TIGR04222 domain-containing membrane protein [Betaproteobacteria bacterium]
MKIPGPIFLLIYIALSVFVGIWLSRVYGRRRQPEQWQAHHQDFARDPYKIAFLRGGRNETVQVAVVSLVDRGLLEIQGAIVRKAAGAAVDLAQYPIEKAVLADAATWTTPSTILRGRNVQSVLDKYEDDLQQKQLIAGAAVYWDRLPALVFALAATLGVAIWRVLYALSQGRTNVLFLIILAIISTVVLLVMFYRRTTAEGKAALSWLNQHFAGLKQRASEIKSGKQAQDIVLLGALFGVSALGFDFIEQIYPPPAQGSGIDAVGLFDSGSDGGGGCSGGGGGCGGGCGGCG